MVGDPIIFIVRDKNCMVSVTIKDVHQKRITRMSDNVRSDLRNYVTFHVEKVLRSIRHLNGIGR